MTNEVIPGSQSAPVAQPRTNTFAILAIVFVWFGAIFGLIFGYVALSQIKRTGERGHGLALAAVIIGWIEVALGLLFLILWFGFLAALVAAGGGTTS